MSKYNIVIEKEYYRLSKYSKEPIIACLMMVKDEEIRIHVSLDSVIGYVKCYIIYDTGSTDKTIEIIKNHCEKHKINLYMIQGEFVNFSVSRNVSLDYADTKDVHFLLLLDSNDELRGGEKLLDFSKKEMNNTNNAYLIHQHWWSGQYDKYYNTRFIKARNNWRYHGSVHEWMEKEDNDNRSLIQKMPEDIFLYQDRTKDGNKSQKRFVCDKELLLADHKKTPEETRILFYLAQTCSCLNQKEEAFYYYKLRSELEGFQEEKFHSYLRCGELSQSLNHPWHDSLGYFMKAIELSNRVEPIIKISQYYTNTKKWLLAYTFANLACSLPYPTDSILFVDGHAYKYTRWHTLGIVAYYCEKYTEGKRACQMAIEAGLNIDLDKSNLEFYEKKEKEIADKSKKNFISEEGKNLNKKQFIHNVVTELSASRPKMPLAKLEKLALTKWKNRS